ncbi:hypothetical protein SAMN06298215_0195 [Bacteroidales bacterium WCE2008]|nr:hypothetical protein SAMN06298215_0195 [Bacteroidales bacterium WCE2008]
MSQIILFYILVPLGVTLVGAGIVELLRHVKKEKQITCEPLSIRQYKEKESGDVSIALTYKNEKVGDSLIVSTIKLTNTGKKDLTFGQVFEDGIGLELKKAKIIDVIVENQSEKVSATVEKKGDENRWFLSWGILKKREFIVLRVVAVYKNGDELPTISTLAKDLVFAFRGNGINNIEFTSPVHIRSLRYVLLIVSILIAVTAYFIPTEVNVLYDVKADGVIYNDVGIKYNDYTQTYVLTGKKIHTTEVKKIESITVSKQPLIPREVIIFEVSLAIYFLIIWLLFVLLKTSSKSSLIKALLHFFFPFRSQE